MPTQKQLAKIHIAKKDLGLSDNQYRDILSGFGVDSARHLTEEKAAEMIKLFKKLGWVAKRTLESIQDTSGHYFKITLPDNRPDEFATQKQINMLVGLWITKSQEKNEQSFRNFVKHIVHYDLLESLQKKDVQKIRIAIVNLKPLKKEN